MIVRFVRAVFIAASVFVFACSANGSSKHLRTFRSSSGFSVEYPDAWIAKNDSRSNLRILSSHDGAEAVIIAPGEAMITAFEVEHSSTDSLDAIVKKYTQDTNVFLRQQVLNARNANQSVLCTSFLEIVSTEDAVPAGDIPQKAPRIVNTQFFCENNRRKYVIGLRNFEDDPKQRIYADVALQVAKSLRITH